MPRKSVPTFFSSRISIGTRVPLGSSPHSEMRSLATCLMATGALSERRIPE